MIRFPRIGSPIETLSHTYVWKDIEGYRASPTVPSFFVKRGSVGIVVARQKIQHKISHALWIMVKILWADGRAGWCLEQQSDPTVKWQRTWYRKLRPTGALRDEETTQEST